VPGDTDDRSRSLGIASGLVAYLLWGLLTVYWKQLTGLNPLEVIGHRVLWAVVFCAAVVAVGRRWAGWGSLGIVDALRSPRLLCRLAVASLLLALNWTTYVWIVTRGDIIEASLGYFIAPLFTVTIGVVVLRERLRRAQTGALALAAVAVGVLSVGYGAVPVAALTLGGTWAVYGLLKKLVPLSAVASLTVETLLLVPAALVVVAVREQGSEGILDVATGTQLVLVALAGAVTAVPLLAFAAAAKRVPLTTLGPLQYLVPSINFLLGWAVYHEAVPGWRLVGFVLVWAALVVLTADGLRAAHRSRRPARDLHPASAPVGG
jgi:chloramphenicol-sensitive protein RarD